MRAMVSQALTTALKQPCTACCSTLPAYLFPGVPDASTGCQARPCAAARNQRQPDFSRVARRPSLHRTCMTPCDPRQIQAGKKTTRVSQPTVRPAHCKLHTCATQSLPATVHDCRFIKIRSPAPESAGPPEDKVTRVALVTAAPYRRGGCQTPTEAAFSSTI